MNKVTFLPVNNGDTIILSLNNYNILIDGGFTNTYKVLVNHLSKNQIKTINLAILTHSDRDHIGGIISLIRDSKFGIENIWFNSYDKLSQLFNNGTKDTSKDIAIGNESDEVSFARAKKLSRLLDEQEREYEAIYREKFLDSMCTIGEIEFTFLSPTEETLYNLYEDWYIEDEKKSRQESSGIIQDVQTIENYANNVGKCKPDDSLQNGSSIAFILKYKEKKFLFLGDAHIDVIVNSLKSLGFNSTNNRLSVDFVKLSHHGSSSNICQNFLDIVDTKKYIISTNGKSHNHPDMETLCILIVDAKAKNKEIELIFNYPIHTYVDEKNILKKRSNQNYYGYSLIFASDITEGITIEF
ncbi:MAG: MBL fold protein [uncultured Sulfurovum sp.]|uniref:MBL fold protein n=1 Tax=uncultured Sulfurovum sp. TaxID=269237 RepID=A0A6S6TQJ0_9BACT|nr:MAG: MBL fold protein [uncultured Sulfurovum sp.]